MSSNNNQIWQLFVAFMIAGALIGFAVLMSSCKTCVPVVETIEKERVVEVHTHDTAIITKADSAQVKLILRCDSANNVLIDELAAADGERIKLQYKLQQLINGQAALLLNCKEDSLRQVIQWQDSVINEMTNHTIVQNVEIVPPYYKGCSIALWIIVACAVVGIIIRILIKVYLKR